jgi:hypothetical protein
MKFEEVFPCLFPVFFIAMWVAICFLLAAIGGWSRLVEYYQSQSEFKGKKWHLRSGRLGLISYNNCLTIGSNYYGLYLAVLPLFRVGHPPLLIPWSDITTAEHKGLIFSYLDFTFAKVSSITFRVPRKLGDLVVSARIDSSYISSVNEPRLK